MREMTVREANSNFLQVIAAAQRGETIIVTRDGTPVAKITVCPASQTGTPEWQSAFVVLRRSLQSKPGRGYRVGTIAEDDTYGD